MLVECEGVLTDTQKKLLENLRRAATEPAAKTPPAQAVAKPDTQAIELTARPGRRHERDRGVTTPTMAPDPFFRVEYVEATGRQGVS